MKKAFKIARRQRGFSLLEMIFVLLILALVLGVVFSEIDLTQKSYQAEGMKLDLTQGSRIFMNQIGRDLHNAGYPTKGMFNPTLVSPALQSPVQNDSRIAAGLVKAAYDELWFEGDVTGNGTVWVVDYKLLPNPITGGCPCTIVRSQIPKINGNPLTGQSSPQYSTILSDVINSGGANGAASDTAAYAVTGSSTTVTGTTRTNDSLFSSYKSANVFTYYDVSGNEITPTNISGSTISNISTVQINVNVLAPHADLQTGMPPVMSYSVAVHLPVQ